MALRTLLIDNYDSYTYNLFQLLAEVTGVEPLVYKNDAIALPRILELLRAGEVHNIVISPGPGTPDTPADVGVCMDVLQQLPSVPILGVCLGHQALAAAAGARVIRAPEPVHGRVSELHHNGHELMAGIPSGDGQGFEVVRYHSLVVDESSLPECLQPIAWTHGAHHAVARTRLAATPLLGQAQPATAMQSMDKPAPHRIKGKGLTDSTDAPSSPITTTAAVEPAHEQHSQTGTQCQPQPPLIMALAHKNRPHYGVQFHPESICTRFGMQMLLNFHRLSCQHLNVQYSLPRSMHVKDCAPGSVHEPHPWPSQQQSQPSQPLGLLWRKCAAAVKSQDACEGLRLFEGLFAWEPHTFWLDRKNRAAMHARFSSAVRAEGSPSSSMQSLLPPQPPPRRPVQMSSKRPTAATKRQSVILICSITLASVFLTSQMIRSALHTRKTALQEARVDAKDHMTRRTLSFDACFGMANQRLSILYGVLFAVELGRTVVLPKCSVSAGDTGQQHTSGSNSEASTVVPFSSIYDTDHFVQAMATVGVDVLTDEEVAGIVKTEVSLSMLEDPLIDLHTKYGSISNLHISCPLFKLKRTVFRESTINIAWKTLAGITPNKANTKLINTYVAKLKGLTRSKQFNLLHLRMESDWVEHCKQVKKVKDAHDNCMAHTDDVDKVLLAYNLPINVPLMVSTMWDLTDPARAEAVLARLRKAGYQVYTSREFSQFYSSDREHNALIDYELAMRATRFVGNSVSTFSALAILQRRQAHLWAAYYNMGPMPIEAHIPAPLLPWVFAYNSATPDDDYMVKVAVKSAQQYMSILPVCLWAGDTKAPIYQWLQEHNVMIIQHQISWGDELWVLAEPHAAHNARHSPLYRSQLELTSDFARVDVAILPQLEQYNYILLTSPYVLFTHEVSLTTVNAALPLVINMHVARSDDTSVPISDVLLLNLLEARSSYEEFKQFVLNSRHGAMFPGYGPGASGAFAQFYEPYMRMDKVLSRLAINAGTNFDMRARILNFEGPKVHDFLHYYRTGSCNWGNACELGLRKSLCPVIKHWQTFMNETEDRLGVSMWYACETLYAPHLFWPKFQPN